MKYLRKGYLSYIFVNVEKFPFIGNSRWSRILLHLLFWVGYYLYFVAQYKLIFTEYEDWQWFVSLSITIWPDLLATYFTAYVLLPKLLLRRKYVLFVVSLLVSAALFILFQRYLLVYIDYPIILPDEAAAVKFWKFNPFYAFVNIYSIAGLFIAIKLLKFWLREQQLRSEMEQQNKTSELAMLRSQVNPHFLFNTLNNIDSLIMIDQEKASDSIIKLSEIMRYMLYDSNTDKVDLESEIRYLRSYISLQRLRYAKPAFVTFSIDGDCHGLKIAPMLFIPFVENAFKHSKRAVEPPGISIHITCRGTNVKLVVENFVENEKEINKDQSKGIGLSNIRRRLELLYPGNHFFHINRENGMYKITLSIDVL